MERPAVRSIAEQNNASGTVEERETVIAITGMNTESTYQRNTITAFHTPHKMKTPGHTTAHCINNDTTRYCICEGTDATPCYEMANERYVPSATVRADASAGTAPQHTADTNDAEH